VSLREEYQRERNDKTGEEKWNKERCKVKKEEKKLHPRPGHHIRVKL
jgi:hypothetical protein